ncbi:dihydroorotase [candidate division WOR-1 bacterium RIFOXYA12_FULL_43_27]|uniref:Dihydroorotase n=1 Tax=candidate division WOR-1 bacterium RIFOXYC2_FULL_46_14 TaxID=1802587 RepID=A0A1F4U6S8_UNCSA|nr:MAG: dihydroorotase [candidate division WOR-1 bacterium RIFOXYA12_FULL_43_27]OGC20665.1 MAG: dihydroorotase [candidate division WOR-1 bacterium RIFOXYB2_FULL_46_45]OGC31598.1 MAG: dihydroorotase [candidate division WOR-1 bacterium RIFOXYA2_FULL_46_56]OGC40003.1 MAG: dihydroorotase [candidate division WOR-1 bacterium RIFOXYC2_FULL_46_14]
MDILIKQGRIIDPANNFDGIADLLIQGEKISAVKSTLRPRSKVKVINAKGMWVVPGLIDLHCHLRDPGDPEEETIASGSASAAAGGFTSIACMANTKPPIDNPAMVKYVKDKAAAEAKINVFPIGAVTKGLLGAELTEMGRMIEEGARAFSDDGRPVTNSGMMRHALEYARQFGVVIISHCEDPALAEGGQMNEGYFSTILGLKGIPALAEEIMVSRDLMLAKEFKGHLHIAHVSTEKSVDLIRKAKDKGVKVTAETCPHYFTLTEEALLKYDTNAKVNPPLRSERDVKAILRGLADGTIDVIATDHAPHKLEKKKVEFQAAATGLVGFETALSLVVTELIDKKILTRKEAFAKMTVNPARILNLHKGAFKEGWDADVTIIDPLAEAVVDASQFLSKSKNTPFNGRKVKGQVAYTIVSGKIVYSNA